MVGIQLISCAPKHAESQYDTGKGATYSEACKQKLNTKSSTEAEMVAIDYAMEQILRMHHFLAAQGNHCVPRQSYWQKMAKHQLQ